MSDIPVQENSIEEPLLTDSDLSLSLKTNGLQRHDQSIEIPVQFSSSSSSFSYDSSTSAIVEQFGTIIKKEAIVVRKILFEKQRTSTFRLLTGRRNDHLFSIDCSQSM